MGHALACPPAIAPLLCGRIGLPTPSSIGSAIVSAFFGAFASWLTQAATWLLGLVGQLLGRSSVPPLDAAWFAARQRVILAACAPVALLALLGATLHSIVKGGLGDLARTVLVRLPVAALLGAAAAGLVGLAVSATDQWCASLAAGSSLSLDASLHELAVAVEATGIMPGAIEVLVAGVVLLGALVLWVELVVRAAAITVATALLPLVLAASLWPPALPWARRLAETIGALIVSKAVIVLVLSVALAAIANATSGPATALTGAAMLLLAAFMPFAVLRLVPAIEAAAVTHLESVRHRAASSVQQHARRAIGIALAGAGGSAAMPTIDPVGSDPVGMLEGIQEDDPLKGTALDPNLRVVKGPPPIVAVPASKGRHVWSRDRIGPRLVWVPPWEDAPSEDAPSEDSDVDA